MTSRGCSHEARAVLGAPLAAGAGSRERERETRDRMPKLTRIYTRTGDDGTTGLVGGQRVKKSAPRIEAYGTVDELSSAIGLARTALAEVEAAGSTGAPRAAELDAWLAWTQDVLFNLGSDLATLPADRWEGMPLVAADDALALERAIDRCQQDLEPLSNFIHPGGSYAGAFLHQARTISRRAERLLVRLAESEPVSDDVMRYVNRLSDALFVWSRWINAALGRPEHLWNPKTSPP
jgi:cob(I)alamin adenosyltransferase